MDIKEYGMCKKCPNGCCKERTMDTINDLWEKICNFKKDDICMFGTDAVISFKDLHRIIYGEKQDAYYI